MKIPRGVSQRHKYFSDKFAPLWNKYRYELSQEEQLILNLGFGLSGEALSYTAIAKRLNYSGSEKVRRLMEDALAHLKKTARQNRTQSFEVYAK